MPRPPNAAPRRTPTQLRGAARVEVILKAAAELFDEIGYDATTTVRIARRARTAVGSLYGFFPNKESIADALVTRFADDLSRLMDGLLTESLTEPPLRQVLDLLIDPLVHFIHTRPGFRALYLKSPHIGEMSAAQQTLESLFLQRITGLLLLRFPQRATPAQAARVARVGMEVVKALTALAIQDGRIDDVIVTDLKAMLEGHVLRHFGSMDDPRHK